MGSDDRPNGRRVMKVPALNVVHVCGTVATTPRALRNTTCSPHAAFTLHVRAYERSKRATFVRVDVFCSLDVAAKVLSHLREGDVVLVTGALQNHPAAPETLQISASIVQFLTSGDQPT
jgi:hypothetical protein